MLNRDHQVCDTKMGDQTGYPDYTINQYNSIIDVLGGCSSETKQNVRSLHGTSRANKILYNMQRAVLSSTLNIGRTFKFVVAT